MRASGEPAWYSGGAVMNQRMVEYRVSGILDGLTPAPAISTGRGNANYVRPNAQQIFVVELPGNLGIIVPTMQGGDQAFSDRFVETTLVFPGSLPLPGARISVVDASGIESGFGATVELKRIYTWGATRLNLTECFRVPQGCAIQIVGFGLPNPGLEHVIRFGMRIPTGPNNEPILADECCCTGVGNVI